VARLLDVAADDVTVDRQGSVDRVEQKQGVDDQAEALQPARRGDHRRPAAAVAGEKKHPGVGMVATLGRNVIKNLAGMDEGVVAENPQATVVERLERPDGRTAQTIPATEFVDVAVGEPVLVVRIGKLASAIDPRKDHHESSPRTQPDHEIKKL